MVTFIQPNSLRVFPSPESTRFSFEIEIGADFVPTMQSEVGQIAVPITFDFQHVIIACFQVLPPLAQIHHPDGGLGDHRIMGGAAVDFFLNKS